MLFTSLFNILITAEMNLSNWVRNNLSRTPQSATQVKRYIRIAELVLEILSKVDNKELSLTPAVQLAYLTQEEQQGFLDAMEYSHNAPSLSQAQRIRKLSQNGTCTVEAMREMKILHHYSPNTIKYFDIDGKHWVYYDIMESIADIRRYLLPAVQLG